jgi:ubiquinone/menaquinone biosynthesis C-methylase UbiE
MTNQTLYPALILDWLTPLYDLFAKLFMPEAQFKRKLIAYARFVPGQRALDLGAGSGTLAILIKQTQPQVQVIGLDGDPAILAIARSKALRLGAEILFEVGNITTLPYPDASFDRVLSSLVFSLLNREAKQQAMREAYRVLRDGGALLIADFGPPHTRWGRWLLPLMRRFEPIVDNLDGQLPVMFREAGFAEVEEVTRFATVLGTLSILQGRKAG